MLPVFAILCVFAAIQPGDSSKDDQQATGLVGDVARAYGDVAAYYSSGEVTVTTVGVQSDADGEPTASFKIWYRREGGLFRFEYQDSLSRLMIKARGHKAYVWSDGQRWTEAEFDVSSSASAMTGVTKDASYRIPILLLRNNESWLQRLEDPRVEGTDEVGGVVCMVLSGRVPVRGPDLGMPLRVWIGVEDKLIRKTTLELGTGGRFTNTHRVEINREIPEDVFDLDQPLAGQEGEE